MIKKYSLLNLDGTIRAKYIDKIIFNSIGNKLLKNNIIIAYNLIDKTYAKFDTTAINLPFLQQEFGVEVPRSMMIPNTTFNDIKFIHYFEPDDQAVSNIIISFTMAISEDIRSLTTLISRVFTGSEIVGIPETPINNDNENWNSTIVQFYKDLINEDSNLNAANGTLLSIDNISIKSSLNNATMDIKDMILREETPLNISNLYNEVIETKYNHCIHDYLADYYPTIADSTIKKLNSVDDIYNWCKQKNIKLRAYDINGNIISTNDPTRLTKNKTLSFIAYNSHLFPIENQFLKKKRIINYKIEIIDNAKQKLIYYLDTNILPADIKVNNNNEIYSFIIFEDKKKIMYLENPEYYKCLEILTLFGIQDKMIPTIKISHLGRLIENLYKKNDANIDSFFPMGREYNSGGYNYNNEDLELEDNQIFSTIDKTKCYPYILSRLPYLIMCDIKYHRNRNISEVIKPHKIIPHYLYIIDIEASTIILPNNNLFEGNTLIEARKNGLIFKILEEQETKRVNNYFKSMIMDLYNKLDSDIFKQIMNIFIGKFECSTHLTHNQFSFDKIIDNKEKLTYNGFIQEINSKYSAGMKQNNCMIINNRKPISIQIKDRSRLMLFHTMKNLGLQNKDIKQIKTDSITFIKTNNSVDKYLHKELSGWKIENYKAITNSIIIKKNGLSFNYKNFNNTGTIGTGYAGNGKTYNIINNIIPKLKEENTSYIVLSPSHATIEEYRHEDLNCDVIQTYLYKNNFLPKEDVIIVDEIGLISEPAWNMLYKCKIFGKNIMVYGDFGQLMPISGNVCNNPNFLKLMFKNQIILDKNHRNNFSKEYYDKLKNIPNIALKEITKHNTPYENADIIIAFTKNMRVKYNKLMCDKLGIENLFDVGAKVICKNNRLADYDIFNNFCFVVKKVVDDIIYFECGTQLPLKIFNRKKYFDYAYARTLHSVQGSTINSFYFCLEDIKYIDNRALYTLISRLKQ